MTKLMRANFSFQEQHSILFCEGPWIMSSINHLEKQIISLKETQKLATIKIDGQHISELDSAGAWFLIKLSLQLSSNNHLQFVNFTKNHNALIDLLLPYTKQITKLPSPLHLWWLTHFGKKVTEGLHEFHLLLGFIGEISLFCLQWLIHPSRFLWKQSLKIMEDTGYRALGITGLLAFLIGVVLAYQMGLQLRNYGANTYIVNLTGLAILREFSPLITAIIIAGRSGSAFTAQLGTMKANEEMDALKTMGISPIERLVLPRLLGLVAILPLLTLWSDIMGVIGGMVMSYHMLGIYYGDFIQRFQNVIELKTFLIGILKAPIFALIIGGIGCFQGFQVTSNAESVGQLTTRSVVQAIFLIICADALLSILLNWYGI